MVLDHSALAGKLQLLKQPYTNATIITHHKSGTLAGMHLIAALCCEQWKPDCTKDPGSCGFWSAWSAGCKDTCRDQGVDFAYNGWWGSWSPNNPKTVVHFLRHPVDMVVSGYLYHLSGAEFASQRVPSRGNFGYITFQFRNNYAQRAVPAIRWLLGATGDESYAQLLERGSAEAGVEAETARAIAAENGIAEMFYNQRRFQPGKEGVGHVVNVCLSDVSSSSSATDATGWAQVGAALPGVDVAKLVEATGDTRGKGHSTTQGSDGTLRTTLRSLAERSLKSWLTEEDAAMMEAFPCQAEEDNGELVDRLKLA